MSVRASPSLMNIGEGFGAFESWLRAHQSSHYDAATATNTFLPILDPFNLDNEMARDAWLKDHARAHDEVNAYLKIAGSDLTELDWKNPAEVRAWVDLNFIEHQQWGSLLK